MSAHFLFVEQRGVILGHACQNSFHDRFAQKTGTIFDFVLRAIFHQSLVFRFVQQKRHVPVSMQGLLHQYGSFSGGFNRKITTILPLPEKNCIFAFI
jgi:hypothetical protein